MIVARARRGQTEAVLGAGSILNFLCPKAGGSGPESGYRPVFLPLPSASCSYILSAVEALSVGKK